MSTNTWQKVHQRGQQTAAVWGTHAPAFKVGGTTLAQHEADLAALQPLAQLVEDQQEVVDDMRNVRDDTLALIKDLATRLPRKLDGELAPEDPWHDDLVTIRNVEMTGLETIVKRGQQVLAVWEKFNAREAAATPARPPLLVGGKTAANLDAAIGGLAAKTKPVETAISVLNDRRSDLRAAVATAHRTNIRWFAAWSAEFAEGSPEHDALSQIDTGSGGSGGNGEPPEPPAAPATPQNVTFTQASPGQPVVADADAVAGATLYKMYSRFIGSPEAPELVHSSATLPADFVATANEFEFTMTASNAGG
jgi:hypothetical protein